jgi:hypothetical protein
MIDPIELILERADLQVTDALRQLQVLDVRS